jgi:hypothetical protein
VSGFDAAAAQRNRTLDLEVRIPIERVNERGQVTAYGTARQRGVTIDDYRTESGIPIKEGPGDSIVVPVLRLPVGDRVQHLALAIEMRRAASRPRGHPSEPEIDRDELLVRGAQAIEELARGSSG